jgi:hypothetical protein
LSYPPGNSVNDCIDEKLTTVQYSKFDNVISIIQTLGEHVRIGKIDIMSAFDIERNLIGPAILPKEISFSTFSYAATGYC